MRPSTPSLAHQTGTSAASLLAATTGVSGVPGASVTSAPSSPVREDHERWEAQQRLADQVYAVLPDADGMTLAEVQEGLHARFPRLAEAARPFVVLEALNHLHHAGWVATSANEPGDVLGSRRYWRAPRVTG